MDYLFIMKNIALFVLLLLTGLHGLAQSGPGGVGTTDGTSNLEIWMDAETNVVTSGALIDRISERSGNGLMFTSTGTTRPDLVTAGLNGRNYTSYNRTNREQLNLSADVTNITSGSQRTIFYVFQFTDDFQNNEIFGTSTAFMFDYGTFVAGGGTRNDRLRIRNAATDEFAAANSVTEDVWHIGVGAYTGTNTVAWNDGTQLFDVNNNAFAWDIDADFAIGGANFASPTINRNFTGDIAEVVLYSTALNSAQRIILENYLAAKYGLPLDVNDVYNEDENAAGDFDYEVAGIGRVDASNQHTDAQGSSIVRISKPVATGLDDDEFLMWGHDNGVQTFVETSDVPAGLNARFNRVWRVSEVSSAGAAVDVGSVDLQFDLTGIGAFNPSDLILLVDADNDGSFADETPISGATDQGSNQFRFAGVTALDNNLRFTLGIIPRAPGGVFTGLSLWLSASARTNTTADGIGVTEWADQSGRSFNFSDAGTNPYLFNAAALNFNPTLDNPDGSNRRLARNQALDLRTITIVTVPDGPGNCDNPFSETGSDRLGLRMCSGGGANWFVPGNTGDFAGSTGMGWFNGVSATNPAHNNRANIFTVEAASLNSYTGIELGDAFLSRYWHGDIAEIVGYDVVNNDDVRNRVESYLAVKYGITLDTTGGGANGDYFASDGSTRIWDASVSPDYHTDVIGIGRDDLSGFAQKQSRTADDSLRVFVSTLASGNSSNAGTMSNSRSYLMIGHNNGRLRAEGAEIPMGVTSRFTREWKVTNTNFTDSYTLEFEWDSAFAFDISHIRLLVDDDEDFSDATVLGPSDGLSFAVGSIVVSGINTSHIPANSTRYITIASNNASTPLPIELINFDATAEDNASVLLEWQTATEINNAYFTIERSRNAIDWEEVKKVNGAGNSTSVLAYRTHDAAPYLGTSYYRLKQTDFDGTGSYSGHRAVHIKSLNQAVRVYPNPVHDELFIQAADFEQNQLKIYNALGQDVTHQSTLVKSDDKGATLRMGNLTKGIYYVKVGAVAHRIFKD